MTVLTELGYLRQPHTSAGRVPTEEGFRFFVSNLTQQTTLPAPMRNTIAHQFYQAQQDLTAGCAWQPRRLATQSQASLNCHRAATRKSSLQAPGVNFHARHAGADGTGLGRW
jgi:transcriptional regulator of heat shock response